MEKTRVTKVLQKLERSGLKLTRKIMESSRPWIYSDEKYRKYVIRLVSKTIKKQGYKNSQYNYPIYYLRFGGLPEKADYLLIGLFDNNRLVAILKILARSIGIKNNEISASLESAYLKEAIWIDPKLLAKTA